MIIYDNGPDNFHGPSLGAGPPHPPTGSGTNQNHNLENQENHAEIQPIHIPLFIDNDGLGFLIPHNLILVEVLDISLCQNWQQLLLLIHNANADVQELEDGVELNLGEVWPGRVPQFDSAAKPSAFVVGLTPWEIVRLQLTQVRLVLEDEDEVNEEEDQAESGISQQGGA